MPDPSLQDSPLWRGFEATASALSTWIHLRIPAPLRHRLEPEEVMQEVAMRAAMAFDRADVPSDEIRPWLFGIARNVMRERLRGLARWRGLGGAHDSTSTWSRVPEAVTTMTRRIARADAGRFAKTVVDQLPEPDRQLVLYHGLEGISLVQTAATLGLEYEAARKRWQRLRDRLREVL